MDYPHLHTWLDQAPDDGVTSRSLHIEAAGNIPGGYRYYVVLGDELAHVVQRAYGHTIDECMTALEKAIREGVVT